MNFGEERVITLSAHMSLNEWAQQVVAVELNLTSLKDKHRLDVGECRRKYINSRNNGNKILQKEKVLGELMCAVYCSVPAHQILGTPKRAITRLQRAVGFAFHLKLVYQVCEEIVV